MYQYNGFVAWFHHCDNHPITLPQSLWRNNNGYHHSEGQQLAPGICLQRVTYSGPRSTNEHRPGSRPAYPEIATATMTGPEDTGTSLRYSFSRAIGSKG